MLNQTGWALTLWCQLEDTFQLIVTPQGIEKVTIQLIDTPTKVYAIGAKLFLSKVPLEVLQNWVLIQLIVTPHILGKVQGQIKEVCRLIELCLLIGTREYSVRTIGVRGVFLQRGGISQPSMLLACFNSAGGANAGLRKSLRGMSHYTFLGENFVLTNLGPRILDRCTHEGKTFLWKTILSSKTVS